MKIKASAVIAAICVCAAMPLSASAQGAADGAGDVVESVGDGAADIVEGVGDGAANIIEGVGDGIEDMTDPDTDGTNDTGNNDTIPGNDYGKDEDDLEEAEDDSAYDMQSDANPATGIPFMPAGLIAVSAAGIAYLTKKRNRENGL